RITAGEFTMPYRAESRGRRAEGRERAESGGQRPESRCRRLLFAGLLLLIGTGSAAAEDWPQFRGPNCNGVSTSKKHLPAKFSKSENVHWMAELGDAVSSPSVANGRVFSTAMLGPRDGKQKFVVFAFDVASGRPLWRKEFDPGPKPLPAIQETNSYASATPAADAERVYVYFTRLGLLALDAKTGDKLWQHPLPEPFYIFDWGPGASPVLFKDMVLFCQDDDVSPALYAVDKRTGELLWKDDRSDMAVSYSHPVICETPKGPEIVVAGTGKLLGYDPATGKRRWAAELFCRNIKTTPVSHNGIVYVSVESTGISYQWRAVADLNGDGKITREEIKASRKDKGAGIPEAFWKKFERGDVNKDGVLEGDEIDKAFLDPSNQGGLLDREVQARGGKQSDWKKWDDELQKAASIQAVRGGGRGDVSRTHRLWKITNKAPDHLVSPLLVDGRLLLIKSQGLSSCFETSKGKQLWYHERIGNASSHLASPVSGDGKIYVAGENGKVVVLASGPKLNVLARNDMGESIIGTPAIADGRLFIRTRTRLYCIEERSLNRR
ncbi:MAG TPA: PQQ-binding-like beta-propeller repeat protein, partial [Gemmataceae bacterium]|nr:PQQ-binding-like beta-propeller repeat protein [Gemmataceae bacterium]